MKIIAVCSDTKDFDGSYPHSCLITCAAVVVGGIDMMSQSLVLAKKPHIVIGKKAVVFHFTIV